MRHSAIYSILLNYEVLQRALADIQTGNDEYAAKASGLLSKMESIETFFSLKLAYLIYSAAERFSSNLQAVNITIQEANNGAQLLAMEMSDIYKDMLTEVDKVLRIYFCFPVTSATAERSFSLLRRLKTFLRSTMCQIRLNNLFMLYVYTSNTDELDLISVAKQFVSVNSRRKNYFGNF